MSNRTYTAKIVTQKQGLEQQFKRLLERAGRFEVMAPENNRQPDLLIYELSGDLEGTFDLVHTMLDTNQVGDVFLTSAKIDTTILLKALKAGITGFFAQPLDEDEVLSGLNKFKQKQSTCEEPRKTSRGRIVYLLGSKGGAGTTTLGVNMATLLSNKPHNLKVVLLDMNMLFGDMPLYLDLNYTCHLTEVINQLDRLDRDFLQACLTQHTSGLQVLPSPRTLSGQRMPTPEIMERILTLFSSMFDFVLIDGGKTLDVASMEMIRMASDIFLISQLNLPALSNAKKLIDFFDFNKLADNGKMKVIVSGYSHKSPISISEAAEALSQKIYWTVPDDEKVCFSALHQGRSINEIAPRSKIGKNLEQLCENFLLQVKQEEG